MKKIEAVIRTTKRDEVCKALEQAGCPGIMITEIEGYGKQKGLTQQWRGKEYKVEFLPKVKLEIIVHDKDVDKIIESIVKSAMTGKVGDGKIFVYPVEDVLRIRTGEKGESAV